MASKKVGTFVRFSAREAKELGDAKKEFRRINGRLRFKKNNELIHYLSKKSGISLSEIDTADIPLDLFAGELDLPKPIDPAEREAPLKIVPPTPQPEEVHPIPAPDGDDDDNGEESNYQTQQRDIPLGYGANHNPLYREKGDKRLLVQLSDEHWEQVKELAKETGATRRQIIRAIVAQGLDNVR